jgi:hypothetical protein
MIASCERLPGTASLAGKFLGTTTELTTAKGVGRQTWKRM